MNIFMPCALEPSVQRHELALEPPEGTDPSKAAELAPGTGGGQPRGRVTL